MDINIEQLSYYIAVAETGGIMPAARLLNVPQQTISSYLKNLAEHSEVPLYRKEGRKIVLTPAGAVYLEAARKIHVLYKETEVSIHALQKTPEIRLGVTPVSGQRLIQELLPEFLRLCPGSILNLVDGLSAELIDMVRNNHLNLAFAVSSTIYPELRYYPIFANEVVLLLPPSHPMGAQTQHWEDIPVGDLSELKDDSFIFPASPKQMKPPPVYDVPASIGQFRSQQDFFRNFPFRPQIVSYSVNTTLIGKMAAAGFGIGFGLFTGDLSVRYLRVKDPAFRICCAVTPGWYTLSEEERCLIRLYAEKAAIVYGPGTQMFPLSQDPA